MARSSTADCKQPAPSEKSEGAFEVEGVGIMKTIELSPEETREIMDEFDDALEEARDRVADDFGVEPDDCKARMSGDRIIVDVCV